MGKRLVGLTLLLAALGMACGDDTGDGGGNTVTGGQQMQPDPAVAACGNDPATTGDGVCQNGFQCKDAAAALGLPTAALGVALNTCACPATGLPPTCNAQDPNACAPFPGTTCQDPGATFNVAVGTYCMSTPLQCTPPSTGMTGGVMATGGLTVTGGSLMTGGMATTGGAMTTGGTPGTGGDMSTGGVAATGGDMATSGGTTVPGLATCMAPYQCLPANFNGTTQNLCVDPDNPIAPFVSGLGLPGVPPPCTAGDPTSCDTVAPGSLMCFDTMIALAGAYCIQPCSP